MFRGNKNLIWRSCGLQLWKGFGGIFGLVTTLLCEISHMRRLSLEEVYICISTVSHGCADSTRNRNFALEPPYNFKFIKYL